MVDRLEDRQGMVYKVSVPLIEQISIDDVQMVLELLMYGVSRVIRQIERKGEGGEKKNLEA